ncbi:MAG: ABC transporter substrate-binding protein [Anaerolineae bacterium]|nr:ABC transporter substrate-binding protein [Anaerolineae bacterium]
MDKRNSLFFTLFIAFLLSACTSSTPTTSLRTIVYGLTLEPSGFDPHIHQSSELGIVLRQVYDTLVYRHPQTNDIVAGLAERWEISDDQLNYTFYLKRGVTFHDGEPFNAQAVGANLDRITSPDTPSQRAVFMLGTYRGYTIIDEFTIQLHLNEPFTPLLDSLAQVYLGIASPKALAEYSVNRYQFHQVGTGPFKFIEYTTGDKLVIRRNENYTWGPEFYGAVPDNAVQEVIFRFFSDPPTRLAALESNTAHIMGEIPPASARAITANSNIQLFPVAIPGMPMQFMFNTTKYPTDNVVVRKALIQATNRSLIADVVYQGFSPVASSALSANTLYFNPQLAGLYPYDPDAAKTMLASVGLVDADENGFLDAGEGDLTVTLLFAPWNFMPETAQLIQQSWRELGIQVVLEQVAGFTALREQVATGEYNLVAFDNAGFDPQILNRFYISTGTSNYMLVQNVELDAILLNAVKERSPEMRYAAYAQVQQFIMENALILPIRDYVNVNAAVAQIGGLVYDSYGWFPLLYGVTLN